MIGDSKTYLDTWTSTLVANLATATGEVWDRRVTGVSGGTVSSTAAWIATAMNDGAGIGMEPSAVLVNLGVNDWNAGVTEAAYKADYLTILDTIHARRPDVTIYMMLPWKRGYDTQANDTAGWISDIQALRSFSALGPDERVWLKGADDGATNTFDGIHYSTAGHTACAAAWQTVMGY